MISRQIKIAWQKVSSLIVERWLRINTTGYVDPVTDEGIHYTPLPYIMVFRMLRFLNMSRDDVFVDVGSGKGRVVCCASRLPVKKVIGIELNESLVKVSRENLRRVRGWRAEAQIVHVSAEDYCYDEATVIYLYNPFTERLTAALMDLIRTSFERSPRLLRLAYANPVHETAFSRMGWLEKYAEWGDNEYPGFGYPVSFWRARGS